MKKLKNLISKIREKNYMLKNGWREEILNQKIAWKSISQKTAEKKLKSTVSDYFFALYWLLIGKIQIYWGCIWDQLYISVLLATSRNEMAFIISQSFHQIIFFKLVRCVSYVFSKFL